jgi:hypothetical protein
LRHFVIGTNRTTAEQDKKFKGILESRWRGVAWWHWISETWLIADTADLLTAGDLRDAAQEAFPDTFTIVVRAYGGATWAGFGTEEFGKWFEEWWKG